MKRYLFYILLFFASFIASGETLVVKGIFLGTNLYVRNPFTQTGKGFCVYEVIVNGQTTSDEIKSSAFEIDLSHYNLKIGDPVSIILRHQKDCTPQIINPEAIKPQSTFTIKKASVDEKEILHWTTSGELGSIPFVVEQFRWNKWITIGLVEAKGVPTQSNYNLAVRAHSGENKFRIKQVDYKKIPKYSPSINYISNKQTVTYSPKRVKDSITFSSPTLYEIYDSYGNIVFKGYGEKINVSELQQGDYYINFDNEMSTFKKR